MDRINPLKRVGEFMDQRKALGRGLGSLIQNTKPETASSKKLMEVPLEDIIANPNQPRKLFSKGAIDELAQSIEEKGILQPLVVRPIGGGKYEIIAGERRYRASKQIGLDKVPVIIKDVGENETLELALIENIQRENLNVVEEALAYKDLLSKFQYTQDELAKRLGKDRSSIANSLRLLKLPDVIRNQLINNQLSMGHARAILAVDDKDMQIQIAQDIIANSLSVRETENLIKRFKDSFAQDSNDDAPSSSAVANAPKLELNEMVHALERRLKDCLKAFVKIQGSAKKGKISIAYANEDELNAITQKLLG